MELPLNLRKDAFFVTCPICNHGSSTTGDQLFESYFGSTVTTCQLGHAIELPDALQHTLQNPHAFLRDFPVLALDGGILTFQFPLAIGEMRDVDLVRQGLPEDARIIRLNLTGVGNVRPLLVHSNQAMPLTEATTLHIYGIPLMAHLAPNEQSSVSGLLSYVLPRHQLAPSISSLASAFMHFSAGHYEEMVIPAVTSLELAARGLARTIRLGLTGVRAKSLLQDVIAAASSSLGIAPLTPAVTDPLHRLWGQRDRMAHAGEVYQPYGIDRAAKQLAAAFIAYRYLLRADSIASSGSAPS